MYELPVLQTDAPGGRFDSPALEPGAVWDVDCRADRQEPGVEWGGSVWARTVCLLRACCSENAESSPGLPHRAVVKMVGDYGKDGALGFVTVQPAVGLPGSSC